MIQSYLISEVANWIPAKPIINNEVKFSRIITDSRTVTHPAQSCFIAISGKNHNGHHHITTLYQQGVRCFMVEKEYIIPKELPEANFLIVENSLLGLQQLSQYKRNLYACPVIGITGSNGKTIVKEWISQLIGKSKVLVRSPRSYNSQVGVPLSVWLLNKETEIAVFEAGISMKDEMERIAPIISPTIGIITNIGAAHQENFSSRKEKLKEKLKLFVTSEIIIYSTDLPFIEGEIKELFRHKKHFTWGCDKQNNLRVLSKKVLGSTMQIELKLYEKWFEIKIPFTDQVSYENAMHAIAALLVLGYETNYIQQAVARLIPVAMRMELKEGVNNCTLINDSYNSDISSLALSLDFLNQQSRKKNEERTLILSDIYQSGIAANELCMQINDLLKQKNISRLIGVGEVLKQHADTFELKAVFYATTTELLNSISQNSFKNEAVLIKGSRDFELEKVCSFLEKQHHQTCLEINLNALVDNLNYYRSKLKESTKVLAMVKAFSYGSGSFEIANVLQHQKIDYLGVAFADEGVELRKSGISLPIIVMNPEAKSFAMMIAHRLEPEIYSFNILNQFAAVIQNEGLSDYPIHIKLDTGMNRLGFVRSDMTKLADVLQAFPELNVKSAFSHLAGADDAQHDNFTEQQINTFETYTNELKNKLGYSFIRHILNSAGILRFPQAQFNMVRLGIGMYGIGAIEQNNLNVVTRFKSYISQIREVKAKETVGYSRKGSLTYDGKIAIVPVGYADGLNRKLGNGVGNIIVNKQRAAIVGNICMDMCMIDITGLNAKEGDEIEVFGIEQSVDELAEALDTIPYEIFTSISRRVKRTYFFE